MAPDVAAQFLAFIPYILEVACSDTMPKTRFPDRASSWRGVPRISHRERTVLTPTARPDHLAADKNVKGKGKGKTIPVRTWTGSECFRRLRIPDFGTFSNLGGNVFSPTHRSPLPPYHIILISV